MRLIDADELKKKIEIEYNNNVGSYCDGLLGAEELIDNAPTVSPDMTQVLAYESGKASAERPQGEWINLYEEDSLYAGECSCCHWKAVQYEDDVVGMPYCPNCGADMRKGEEE